MGVANAGSYRRFGPGLAAAANLAIANAWKNPSANQSSIVTVAPSAGNLLVVWIPGWQGDNVNHSVSDNIGGTGPWIRVGGAGSGTSQPTGSIWYQANVPAGITAITCNVGTGATFCSPIIHEVSGASASPFTPGEFSINTFALTVNPQTNQVTNGTAKSIYFAFMVNDNGSNPGTAGVNGTGTDGTWNLFSATNSQELNGASFAVESVPNQLVSSSAPHRHGWTTSNDLGTLGIVIFH